MDSSRSTEHLSSSGPSPSGRNNQKQEDEEYDFNQRISVPAAGTSDVFSFRKLWLYTGPGFLMSIAYLDPGNIESDLQSGAVANYKLLWLLMSSTIFGLMMQRLAARLGTVTGRHLAELCKASYPTAVRYVLWFLVEIAVIGSDMQEVIGTSIAWYLLTNRWLPPYIGVLITILDTFLFLMLDKYGLRKLECFFVFLITVMALTFGFEYYQMAPPQLEVVTGLFYPWCDNCDYKALEKAIGIIGAVIMPHNLYLHSALVRSRKIDRSDKRSVSEANKYFFAESAIALFVSLIINIFVMSVFAEGLYGKTNQDIFNLCANSTISYNVSAFENNLEPVDVNIYKAGIFLGCKSGLAPLIIWAIGILAAGQSSTMTGTYAGQFIMEGFFNFNISRWLRMFITRSIAIGPTLLISLVGNLDQLSNMNDFLNAVMSMQLPFALIPCLTFACSDQVMGDFKSGRVTKVVVSILSALVISINLFFVTQFIEEHLSSNWAVYVVAAVFTVAYVAFLLYLTCCLFVVFGFSSLTKIPVIGSHFILKDIDQLNSFAHQSDDTLDSDSVALLSNEGGDEWRTAWT